MKKRILALALAGTTAFSVFGGLNVFAKAVNYGDEAYEPYTLTTLEWTNTGETDTLTIGNTPFDGDESAKDLVASLEKVIFDEDVTVDNGEVYMFDYTVKDSKKVTALKDLISTIGNDTTVNAALINSLADAFEAAYDKNTKVTGDGDYDTFRRDVTTQFYDLDPLAPSNFAEDENEDVPYKYEALWTAIDDLKNDDTHSEKEMIKDKATSELLYLVQEYDRIVDMLDLADTTSTTDWIDIYMSVLDARSAEDYKTASDYNRNFYSDYLDLQDDYADAETPSDLLTVKTKMFNLIKDATGTSAGVDKSALETALDIAAEYKAATYKNSDGWDYFNDIKTEAQTIFDRPKSYSYQSTVDAYADLLTEAIAALDPSSASKDWAILYLETEVEEANDKVETDYTASGWKTFVAVRDRAETLLASDNTNTTMLSSVAKELEKAIATLATKAKSVPYSTRTALKNAIADAEDLLDEMTDTSSGSQLIALTTAINDADDLWKTKYTTLKDDTLISEVEAATAALEEAMTLAQHPQGWYQNENGTWFYGVGTENYTGWLELNGRTYFLQADGSMAASTWVKTEAGYWYYLNASGAMLHDGWAKINDTWYYFKNFGGMAEGWVKDGNTWYYLQPGSGKMVTGWNLINGKYYYFDASGAMLANTTTPDGYKVDASGAWVK